MRAGLGKSAFIILCIKSTGGVLPLYLLYPEIANKIKIHLAFKGKPQVYIAVVSQMDSLCRAKVVPLF